MLWITEPAGLLSALGEFISVRAAVSEGDKQDSRVCL